MKTTAKGRRAVGRPPSPHPARPISIRVPADVLTAVQSAAAARGVPYQTYINDVLRRHAAEEIGK